MLGHKSLRTTQVYTHVFGKDIKKLANLLFLLITVIFYFAFYSNKSYRILDIYSNISCFLILLGVLL